MDSRKYLSHEERQQLETMLTERLDRDLRNCTIFLTALYSGTRPQELLNLRWDNIDTKTGVIRIDTIKKGKPRSVPVPKIVRDALERLKTISPDRPFNISSSRLCELWHMYRPSPTKTMHCLRHTFAIGVLKKSGNLKLVQQALGHRNIQNTMVYLDFDYDMKDMKKLMRIR
jgi:integrase